MKIVFFSAGTMVFLLVLPFILLSINPIQNFVAQKVIENLSETLQTEVKIGHIDLRYFNTLSIEDFLIKDHSGDTLIAAKRLDGDFSLLKLFKKRVEIQDITLKNTQINLFVDTTGMLNAEFLKILFEKKENEKQSVFVFQIDDIQIINSSFSFKNEQKIAEIAGQVRNDKEKKSKGKTCKKFNPADIFLSNINTRISISEIADKSFAGKIKTLSFSERCGLVLKNFATDFSLNDSIFRITKTKIQFEQSEILLDSILLTYNGLDAIKTNFEKTGIETSVFLAKLKGSDFAPFAPRLANIKDDITLRIRLLGSVENLIIERLEINIGDRLVFSGNAQAAGLPDLQHTFVFASINNLHSTMINIQDFASQILRKPIVFPKELLGLKKVSYKGKISGYVGNLSLLGLLTTGIGSIKTDLAILSNNHFQDMVIEGNINTSGLDLAAVSADKSGLGKIILNADATVRTGKNVPFESKIKAQIKSFVFKNYNYNNLIINGNLSKNTFEGKASIDDENGKLNFYGLVNLDKNNSQFHFNASVSDFKPNKLNLIKNYPDLNLAFRVNADFQGNKIDSIRGQVVLDSVFVRNNGLFRIDKLAVFSKPQSENQMLVVESDLINGSLSGNYSLKSLPKDFIDVAANYMPILKNLQKSDNEPIKRNIFAFDFEVEPLQPLCEVLGFGVTTISQTTMSGFYNGNIQRFNAEIDIPKMKNGGTVFNGTNLHCYNEDKNIKLYISSMPVLKTDSVSLIFKAAFANDNIQTLLLWKNSNKKAIFAGEFLAKSHLFKEKDSIMLSSNILPTQIVLKNNILNLKKSNITTNFNWIDVKDFAISGKKQDIFINGRASKSINDHIFVDIENFDLSFIDNFMRKDVKVSFGGLVSGKVDISRAFQQPIIEAKAQSPQFIFNNAIMGNADVTSHFDLARNCLVFNGIVTENTLDTVGILKGEYHFKRDSLDIIGDGRNLNLGFIHKFTEKIIDELDGRGTGIVHIIGLTKKRQFTVETAAKVKNGHLKIGYLHSDFYFEDSIVLKKDSILFRKIPVLDAEGNKGMLNGYVAYKYFNDINYHIDLQSNKMLIFNTKKGGELPFWGKGYATGTGLIAGDENQTNISCNVTSEPNTKVYIPLDNFNSVTSNDFITFVNKNEPETPVIIKKTEEKLNNRNNKKSSSLTTNIVINVTPTAEVQLIMDSRAGDKINAAGDGNVRIVYDEKTDEFKMFGNYNLLEGKYLFTLQDAIRREFRILEGSSLQWNGAPSNPTININAVYQVDAPLTDLFDDAILSKSNRKNVPVNCLLNLSGNLLQPVIDFDLNLPNSDDELNRALKNIVNTEEMMNREIIYLLAFGHFYRPEYMNSNTNSTSIAMQNEAISVVTSTISQQLNTMASQLFDNWNFGVNLRFDDANSTSNDRKYNNEYSVLLNYAPNNRLSITSNVGYRDDKTSSDGSGEQTGNSNQMNNYILDFELEYKLIQSGKLSAKAYNRTNNYDNNTDIRNDNNMPYTQGIGLVYRESFNSLKELSASWKKNREERKAAKKLKKEEKAAKKQK
ncbi:MAG: translocation/assembly module TamB domain-containing protein [Prevotellaceae bacterium]|nr:translocation/assembly module TamB domain-containing protein [Prevotellaceae bacterium]